MSGKKINDHRTRAAKPDDMIRRRPQRSDQAANAKIDPARMTADDTNTASVVVKGRPSCRVAYETKYTTAMKPRALLER